MNAISTDSMTWMGVGIMVGGFFGGIITFWVAEGIGFRQGVILTQKHHETLVAHKCQKYEPEEETTEMPAPDEIVEAEREVEPERELAAV